MQRKLIFICLIALSGCKHESKEDAWAPSGPPYLVTDSGVFVYWESEKDPLVYSAYTPEEVENLWIDTQQCLSMEAEPPIIVVSDDIHTLCELNEDSRSGYCRTLNPNIIVHEPVNANSTDQDNIRSWKHEFIHHIMEMNGRIEHMDHKPDWLWQCQYN